MTVRLLTGWGNEPQHNGAVVAVHYGDYRRQELWVRSGAHIGAWYCLGGEFDRPKVWIDHRSGLDKLGAHRRAEVPGVDKPGPGQVTLHPGWDDVLARGPVTLLVAGGGEDYERGRAAAVRQVRDKIDTALEWLEIGVDD